MEIVIAILILIVGLVLREELFKIKRTLQKKEMQDVCDYINDKQVFIRTKDCKGVGFHAHVARHENSYHDCIIIDLD
jgi:hypothetical protein